MSYTLVIMLLWSFVLHQRVRAVDATDTLMDGGKPDAKVNTCMHI